MRLGLLLLVVTLNYSDGWNYLWRTSQEAATVELRVLRNVFEKSSTPVGVVATRATRDNLRATVSSPELEPLLGKTEEDSELAYIILRMPDTVTFPCSLWPHPPDPDFGPNDPFHVEITNYRQLEVIGTSRTRKAVWVRTVTDTNLAVLSVPNLEGPAVVAAFSSADIAANQYVVLYRRKHWPTDRHIDKPDLPDTCGGHTHLQATWARLQ